MKSFRAIWKYKCPRCHGSDMFSQPFSITKPLDMHDSCGNCKMNFMPEPGFYFGAMFVSYGLACLTFLPLALLLVFAFDWELMQMMYFVFFLYFVSFFKIMRLSRSIWAHFVIKYDSKYKAQKSME